MSRSLTNKVLLGVVLAVVFYAALAFVSDLSDLQQVGATFNWPLLPGIMGLALGNYIVRAFRWHMYLSAVGVHVSIRQSLIVFMAGLGMSVTPGKLGELLKAHYIKNINGTSMRVTGPVIIAERLTDLVGVILIASIGVFTFNYGLFLYSAIIILVAGVLVTLSSRRISKWIVRRLSIVPFVARRSEKLEGAIDHMARLNRLPYLLPAVLLSILAWAFEGVGFYLVINSFSGVEVSLSASLFIYAFSILVGAVSMIPGGLGATEGAMTGLLVLLRVPKATAFAATLITRLATLWFAVALGLLTMGLFRSTLDGAAAEDDELRTIESEQT